MSTIQSAGLSELGVNSSSTNTKQANAITVIKQCLLNSDKFIEKTHIHRKTVKQISLSTEEEEEQQQQ